MSTPSLLDRIETVIADYGTTRGIVAVSGGPDSVALTRALHLLRDQHRIGPFVLAHLNHQLRGAESDADEAFVAQLAAQLGLEFRCQRMDAAAEARARQDNLENCSRTLRYEWLTELAQSESAAWVATGHSADDQAETVLFRLLRGAGMHGLGAIPERRELAAGIHLIRPLLHVTRAEILAFLPDIKQPFRQDASNLDTSFTRNRIRQELLPLLAEQYNPAIGAILGRLAEQARDVERLLQPLVTELLSAAELPRAGDMLVFDASVLARADRYLTREVLRHVWQRERWSMGEMSFADWERLADLTHADSGAMDFPGRIRARRTGRVLQIGPAKN
jgi:tRNA(Ile)-lysidine synthase